MKKVWLLALLSLFFSWFLMLGLSQSQNTGLYHNANAANMSYGWTISDETQTLYENAAFVKTGSLKNQNIVTMTKVLPATEGKSICFTTIGYMVDTLIDGNPIDTFGSSPDGSDVWGVKTHIIKIPDGGAGRELKLKLETNDPKNIAVSMYVLLDAELDIIDALLKSNVLELIFSLLFLSVGVFMMIYSLISFIFKFRRYDFSLLMLAFIALFMGCVTLFNDATFAYYTGPEFVYWIVNILNLAFPIPVLLYVAADKGFKNSRLLITVAVLQSAFVCVWLLCEILNVNIFLRDWHLFLSSLIIVTLAATFIHEFIRKQGRPELVLASAAIVVASILDAYIYFTEGIHYSMNYNLYIVALPVLVLMIGKVVLSSVQRELEIINENATLRIEGNLLFKNYNRLDHYIDETKKIWHDIDKHYCIIGSLASDGEYDELDQYLKNMGHDLKKVKKSYLCDNKLINAILTDKIAEAEDAGIQVGFTGNLPEKLNIQGNDICGLLVNMLDNAIEACEKVPEGKEKKIDISIRFKNDFVYFGITNSCYDVNDSSVERPSTSKEEKEIHGYGLLIIESIARKYDGAFDIFRSQDSFTVKAALNNAKI